MKKLSILFVLVLSLFFVSCDKDDDNESDTSTTASIEGKWNFSKMSMTFAGVTSPEEDYPGNSAGCNKNYLEIKTGGVANYGAYAETSCELITLTGTWTKNGNTLTVKFAGEDDWVYEIASVTDSTLTLKKSTTQDGQTATLNSIFTK